MDEIDLLLDRLVIRNDDGRGSFFSSTLGPTNVFGEEAPFDEGLDLLLQLNAIVHVVAMVTMEAQYFILSWLREGCIGRGFWR